MSGIFGCFNFDQDPVSETILQAMSQSVIAEPANWFAQANIALGGGILSANTTASPDSSQTTVVLSGKIFNAIEMRHALQVIGKTFQTTNDSEVILHAYDTWGPEFVSRLNGVFAIAIHDGVQDQIWLYRDRLGVESLYLTGTPVEGCLWFASDVKSLLANGQNYGPNLQAIAQFLTLEYISQPLTAFEGISQLAPGHMACVTMDNKIETRAYWLLSDVKTNPEMSEAEAKTGIVLYLDDATRMRMRSDGPFGAYLSGGSGSSSVVGMMSLYQTQPLHTFSVGHDVGVDDASDTRIALMAAKRFEMRHSVQPLQPRTPEQWALSIWQSGQPIADVSAQLDSQLASSAIKHVKTVLTDDGIDALFAGQRYRALASSDAVDGFVCQSGPFQGGDLFKGVSGDLKDAFEAYDPYEMWSRAIKETPHLDPVNQVLYAELTTGFAGSALAQSSTLASLHSLEHHSPFWDHRMVEFALSIPGYLKLRDGETKWIFKKAIEPMLGSELAWHTQHTYTQPVDEQFRDILLGGRLEARGLFDKEALERMFNAHMAGSANYSRQLHALISLEIWYRLFVDGDTDLLTNTLFYAGRDQT